MTLVVHSVTNKFLAFSSLTSVHPWIVLQRCHFQPHELGPAATKNDGCSHSGWWLSPPVWKISKSIGMTIPNIWENIKCSKPPTSIEFTGIALEEIYAQIYRRSSGNWWRTTGFWCSLCSYKPADWNVDLPSGSLWCFNIAIENGHRNSEFSHKELWLSMVI